MAEEKNNHPVRVRIAPSPTGDPHVGTAYIALFNWMFAKQHKGKFVLRIEDTDQSRCSPESEQMIFDSLRWLGLDFDEAPDIGGDFGPYRQSERLEIYQKHAQELVQKEAAYPCFCDKSRLDELKALQRKLKKPQGYDGHCRYMDPKEIEERLASGQDHVIRLKVDRAGEIRFEDGLRGEIVIANKEVDDQVLLKSDGFPTYHLANVVDDHLMEISHVIRAEEWITSVPKHIMLYQAFGWEPPTMIHMPLLRNKDKSKISKRKNPVSLNWYRDVGYLPETMLNFLALQGWSLDGENEKFSRQQMLENFDIQRVSLSGPVFDLDKLNWLNGLYIRELESDRLLEMLKPHMTSERKMNEEQVQRFLPLVQERLHRLDEWDKLTYFFHPGPIEMDPELLRVRKKNKPEAQETHTPSESMDVLEKLTVAAHEIDWTLDSLDNFLRNSLKSFEGWKSSEFFMLVRKATTGTSESPPLFDTLAILGRDICLERWQEAVRQLNVLVQKA